MNATQSRIAALGVIALSLLACSGPASPGGDAQSMFVEVAPQSAQVPPSGTVSFAATVSGTANPAVTWAVTEAAGGTVSSGGQYVAPGTTGTFHVVVTSVADPTVKATAQVVVTDAPPTTVIPEDGSCTTTASTSGAAVSPPNRQRSVTRS